MRAEGRIAACFGVVLRELDNRTVADEHDGQARVGLVDAGVVDLGLVEGTLERGRCASRALLGADAPTRNANREHPFVVKADRRPFRDLAWPLDDLVMGGR